ncbi:MAG TPA: FeoA family protein [Polyangiaceae bacterium]|nr:FeoA family protein [Polyangiaceae bacterium]
MPERLPRRRWMWNGDLSGLRLRVSTGVEALCAHHQAGTPFGITAIGRAGTSDGARMTSRLLTCAAGDRVVVGSVDAGAGRVNRLASLGILPGVELRVQQTRPVFVVECDETVLALEREIAAQIAVVHTVAGAGNAR